MTKACEVALLLPDVTNPYERALATEASDEARRQDLNLLPAHFAGNNADTQLTAVLEYQRRGAHAQIVLPVRPDGLATASQSVVRSGGALVFLNRPPRDLPALRRLNPETLVACVHPDQVQIGRLQGEQCRRMLSGARRSVLYVTGADTTPSAHERRAGFRQVVAGAGEVHEVSGMWSTAEAARAVRQWFRTAGERARDLGAIVCQNDAMAAGARMALLEEAARSGGQPLGALPLFGVDGLPDDGQRRVRSGDLAATVVVPLSSGPAVRLLAQFWANGQRTEDVALAASSYPPLEQLSRKG
jgi:ABC-type sugar transport system substrate-binding protein